MRCNSFGRNSMSSFSILVFFFNKVVLFHKKITFLCEAQLLQLLCLQLFLKRKKNGRWEGGESAVAFCMTEKKQTNGTYLKCTVIDVGILESVPWNAIYYIQIPLK